MPGTCFVWLDWLINVKPSFYRNPTRTLFSKFGQIRPSLLILTLSKNKSTLNLSFESHSAGLFIILGLFGAVALSYFLYYRNAESSVLTRFQKGFLFLLRSITLFLIFLFLLSPHVDHSRKIRQLPVLAVAVDNSESDSAYLKNYSEFKQILENRFAGKYQLDFWTFGEKAKISEKTTGIERRSDYGQILKALKDNYINKNMGAAIVIGDGIYNQGQNPENIASKLNFPVYTLGAGDTTKITDARIARVRTNKQAFLKNKFPVELELKFFKLKGKLAQFDVENNKNLVYSGQVSVSSDDDFQVVRFDVDALQPGLQHYTIRLKPFEGEKNLGNNVYQFVIQVLENKQKILMVSNGPHPDLGAIRNSLEELQNYEVKEVTGSDTPDSLQNYSLIILNQLPAEKNAATRLLEKIKAVHIPVLFLVGPLTLTDQLNILDMGITLAPSPNTEEVQAVFNPNFSLFVLSSGTRETFEQAPPLVVPFGNTTAAPQIQTLATQNIRNVKTNKTLLAFGTEKGRKTGFIMGEGIWRWRLYDYQVNGNHDAFNELIHKIVQYLALRQNEDNFNVIYPALFEETDDVKLTAELYNDSYELVNTPDVLIRIKNDSLREFNYQFDRTDNYYTLNAGSLRPGDYSFEAETTLGNQHFTEKGKFSVVKNEIEQQNKQADFEVLYQIAQLTGGEFQPMANSGMLLDKLANNKRITTQVFRQNIQSEWISLKLLFLLLVATLAAEWFFRKFWGIY